jgi:hypothetical protein
MCYTLRTPIRVEDILSELSINNGFCGVSLSSHLLSKNFRLKYTKLLFYMFCMGVKPGLLYKLKVFENRVLKRMFWNKEEVAEGWRRLHNEELHNLCASPSIRVM